MSTSHSAALANTVSTPLATLKKKDQIVIDLVVKKDGSCQLRLSKITMTMYGETSTQLGECKISDRNAIDQLLQSKLSNETQIKRLNISMSFLDKEIDKNLQYAIEKCFAFLQESSSPDKILQILFPRRNDFLSEKLTEMCKNKSSLILSDFRLYLFDSKDIFLWRNFLSSIKVNKAIISAASVNRQKDVNSSDCSGETLPNLFNIQMNSLCLYTNFSENTLHFLQASLMNAASQLSELDLSGVISRERKMLYSILAQSPVITQLVMRLDFQIDNKDDNPYSSLAKVIEDNSGLSTVTVYSPENVDFLSEPSLHAAIARGSLHSLIYFANKRASYNKSSVALNGMESFSKALMHEKCRLMNLVIDVSSNFSEESLGKLYEGLAVNNTIRSLSLGVSNKKDFWKDKRLETFLTRNTSIVSLSLGGAGDAIDVNSNEFSFWFSILQQNRILEHIRFYTNLVSDSVCLEPTREKMHMILQGNKVLHHFGGPSFHEKLNIVEEMEKRFNNERRLRANWLRLAFYIAYVRANKDNDFRESGLPLVNIVGDLYSFDSHLMRTDQTSVPLINFTRSRDLKFFDAHLKSAASTATTATGVATTLTTMSLDHTSFKKATSH